MTFAGSSVTVPLFLEGKERGVVPTLNHPAHESCASVSQKNNTGASPHHPVGESRWDQLPSFWTLSQMIYSPFPPQSTEIASCAHSTHPLIHIPPLTYWGPPQTPDDQQTQRTSQSLVLPCWSIKWKSPLILTLQSVGLTIKTSRYFLVSRPFYSSIIYQHMPTVKHFLYKST